MAGGGAGPLAPHHPCGRLAADLFERLRRLAGCLHALDVLVVLLELLLAIAAGVANCLDLIRCQPSHFLLLGTALIGIFSYRVKRALRHDIVLQRWFPVSGLKPERIPYLVEVLLALAYRGLKGAARC